MVHYPIVVKINIPTSKIFITIHIFFKLFNAPIEDLLDTKDKDIKELILDNSSVYEIVNRRNIEKILNQDKITNETSKFLFSFLGTKIFLENFN